MSEAIEQEHEISAQEKIIMEKYAKQVDYKTTFGTEHGKRVLKDLMNCFHVVNGTTLARPHPNGPSMIDPYLSIYNEGQRSVVVGIMKMLSEDTIDFMREIQKARSASVDDLGGVF